MSATKPSHSRSTKAFVVSLVDSPRRASILSRLARSSLEIVLVDAIDARHYDTADQLIPPAAQRRMRQRYGREISKNEMCAVLSHLAALSRVADEPEDTPALVLEDDAELQAEVPDASVAARASVDVLIAGYTKLSPAGLSMFDLQNPFVVRQRMGQWSIVERYHNQTPGALAYFVRPATARRMTQLAHENGAPTWVADDWGFYESAGLRIAHLYPTLFLENDSGVSYLESGRQSTGLVNVRQSVRFLALRRALAVARRAAIRWRGIRTRS